MLKRKLKYVLRHKTVNINELHRLVRVQQQQEEKKQRKTITFCLQSQFSVVGTFIDQIENK